MERRARLVGHAGGAQRGRYRHSDHVAGGRRAEAGGGREVRIDQRVLGHADIEGREHSLVDGKLVQERRDQGQDGERLGRALGDVEGRRDLRRGALEVEDDAGLDAAPGDVDRELCAGADGKARPAFEAALGKRLQVALDSPPAISEDLFERRAHGVFAIPPEGLPDFGSRLAARRDHRLEVGFEEPRRAAIGGQEAQDVALRHPAPVELERGQAQTLLPYLVGLGVIGAGKLAGHVHHRRPDHRKERELAGTKDRQRHGHRLALGAAGGGIGDDQDITLGDVEGEIVE